LERSLTVFFIGCQRLEREKCDGDIVGTLGRQEIPMVLTAEPLDQGYPHLAIALELGGFIGIYNVL
jgi:hypothetical protein